MTSENVAEQGTVESAAAVSAKAVDDRLIDELVSRARAEGLPELTGEGGLLQQLTRRLLESDVEGEITDHLAMTSTTRQAMTGATPRNGKRAKTLLTEIGPLELLSVPHPQRAVAPSPLRPTCSRTRRGRCAAE